MAEYTTKQERSEHQVVVHHVQGDRCASCWDDWPCFANRLIAHLEAALDVLRNVAAADYGTFTVRFQDDADAVLGDPE